MRKMLEKEHKAFMKRENDKLVEALEEEKRQKELKKIQNIKEFNEVWASDIKIKEMQDQIDENLRTFNLKLAEQPLTESDEDATTMVSADTEFNDNLMTRLGEENLTKNQLKEKLVELC